MHYHEILNKMPLFLGITLSLCCLVTVFYSVSNSHLQLEAGILRRKKLLWKSFTAYPNPSKMQGLSTYLTLCHPSFLSSVVSVSAILFFFFPNSNAFPSPLLESCCICPLPWHVFNPSTPHETHQLFPHVPKSHPHTYRIFLYKHKYSYLAHILFFLQRYYICSA